MREFMKLKQSEKTEMEKMIIDQGANEEEDNSRVQPNLGAVGKEKSSAVVPTEQVEGYEEAFAKIEAATGIHDIDVLVNTFIQAEEKNFVLFKFVNDLSNDIEGLEATIQDLKDELNKYKTKGMSHDSQRNRQLKELEDQLSKKESRAEHFELQYQQNLKKVNSIKTGIESIFTAIDCDAESTQELLGTQGVTESNMMIYLGIIE